MGKTEMFFALLERETAEIRPKPVILRQWTPKRYLCEISWQPDGRLRCRVNVRALSGDGAVLARFLARRLSGLAGQETGEPRSYLEGLRARLDEKAREEKKRLYPALPEMGQRPRYTFGPAELFCLICALQGTKWERKELYALAEIPEIGYFGGKLPEGTLNRALAGEHDTLGDYARACEAGEAPWEAGVLLRVLCLSEATELGVGARRQIIRAAETYRAACRFLAAMPESRKPGVIRDALAAALPQLAKIDRLCERFGCLAPDGTVHLMD